MQEDRRQARRLEKTYRLEYGPFSAMLDHSKLRISALNNMGKGGLMFAAEEGYPVGSQLFLRIFIPGWCRSGDVVEQSSDNSEMLLQAVAEVRRVEFDRHADAYIIGAKFSGQVNA
ncbi:MAG: hypothetical protein GY868_06745 [Deltaproteobacteria bacterium]|nr:hypothetical protein [Deltaproteobacteria bacterium]